MESAQADDAIMDNQHGARKRRGDSHCCPEGADGREGVLVRKEVPPCAWLCFPSRDGSGWFFPL